MLLAQTPQLGHVHHRRHPASLATITALPHPVPGLLTLSKPPRRHPSRPQSPRRPPRPRIHRPKTADLSVVPRPVSDTPVPFPEQQRQESTLTDTPAPAVVQQPSGRLARSRRSRHKSTPAVNQTPTPRTSSPPRQPQPSAPISVPNARRNPSPASYKILSRSDPLSKLTIETDFPPQTKSPPRKDRRRRNKNKPTDGGPLPLADWDFPVPGDDEDDESDDHRPSTPVAQIGANHKAWSRVLDDPPKTAPIQSSAFLSRDPDTFPAFQFPPRAKTPALIGSTVPMTLPVARKRPEHRRAPSHPASLGPNSTFPEAMFHLSDDEAEKLPVRADVREKIALLFRNGSGSIPSSSPSPRRVNRPTTRRESVDGVARQLFASSSFQIAPEPVELPKPSFLSA